MLKLPSITLLGMDCVNPLRTIKSMQYSMLQAWFGKAVLVTSMDAFRPEMLQTVGGHGRLDINVHFTDQGGRDDYERAMICELARHFQTSHCLVQEWDSAVINPRAWSDEWLEWDYIGAPWPFSFNERGYPPCTEDNCVGNGGFSLRSHTLCQRTAEIWNSHSPGWQINDAWICRTMRQTLEKLGCRFAPYEVAAQFSCENRIHSGQFGSHGKTTIKLNGWNWNFSHIQ